jgi:hypothetical protein
MKLPTITRKRSFILGTAAILLLLGVSFGLWVKSSKAIIPFGGPITSVFYCPCSANLAVVVGPPSPGIFMYQPGASTVYAFYQIFRPGPWVLGNYVPGGACMMFIPYGCAPMAFPMGTINEVGTSL